MDKAILLETIRARLGDDLALLDGAARKAHEAATHEENIPDNKYATLALEASYIAQGQANRAQQIRQALAAYRQLELRAFADGDPVRLGALVELEDEDGGQRSLFLGPAAGGLKLVRDGREILVVTPDAPLGRALLGCRIGDEVELGGRSYEILSLT